LITFNNLLKNYGEIDPENPNAKEKKSILFRIEDFDCKITQLSAENTFIKFLMVKNNLKIIVYKAFNNSNPKRLEWLRKNFNEDLSIEIYESDNCVYSSNEEYPKKVELLLYKLYDYLEHVLLKNFK